MTPEQLKASILQRAMEGKLVPQDPNDEPASELLKRIKAEKEKLIKEGKIKRDKNETEIFRGDDGLHYEKFQDGSVLRIDVPFEIPESWEWVNLGQVGTLQSGAGIKKSETVSKGIQCVRYGEIYTTYDYFFTETVSSTTSDVAKRSLAVNVDDILITLTGENKKDIGKAVAYLGNASCVMGGDLSKLSNHKMNAKYLSLVLNSPNVKAQKSELATGNIIVHISNSKLEKILVPIPPIKEQREIVDKVEYYFSFVDEYKIAQNKLKKINDEFPEKLQKSILQYAMQGKLVPQDATDEPVEALLERIREEKQKLFEEGKLKKKDLQESIIYLSDDNSYYEMTDLKEERENWLFLRVKDIFRTIPIKKYQIKQSEILKEGLYPVVSQSKNLIEGYTNSKDKLYQHSKPIIVFGDHTRIVKLVNFDFVVGADGVKLMEPIYINSEFGYLCLKFCCLDLRNRGYSRHYSHLQKMYIGIPNKHMQLRIVEKITILDRYVNLLENKINKHI